MALPPAERAAYLDGLDAPVREAVEALLGAAALAEAEDVERLSPPAPPHPRDVRGTRVGPYRIDALIGEGGMGRVYRAHRADGAFDQTVALKLVRTTLALAGSDVAERLRRERAVLAALDHPGIARLLDGGETDDGVPYLATAYVDGVPITEWAETQGIGVPERVRLLAEAARAVEHAHRRGVVHRDLKPPNVLITEIDEHARPVVLDFGVAKLAEAAEDRHAPTLPGTLPLTPAYAAPELLTGAGDVTTATDVYGLGVLLYELLTGTLPYGERGPRGPHVEEPVPPSLATRPEGTPRPTLRTHPTRALRGDLDVICLKALHADPARRYGTAAALADDLDRHLAGEPVEARPDSWAYVAGRYFRRHRSVAITAGALLLAIFVGFGTTLVALSNERTALRSEQVARAEAEAAAARATEATALLTGLFESANPVVADGRDVTLREALDDAIGQVAQAGSPELQGHLTSVLGWTYYGLGDLARADSLLTAGLRSLERSDAPPPALAKARVDHARLRAEVGDWEGALRAYQRAYEEVAGDPALPSTYAVLTSLPWVYRSMGRHEDAIRASHDLIDHHRATDDADREGYALYEMGQSLIAAGKRDEGTDWLRESHSVHSARHGLQSSEAVHAGFGLSGMLVERGALEEAEPLIEDWVRYSAEKWGPEHRNTAMGLEARGRLLIARGDHANALPPLEAALAVYRASYPETHASMAEVHLSIAEALNALGRPEEALLVADTSLAIATALAPIADATAARAQAQRGFALRRLDRPDDARRALQRAADALRLPAVQLRVRVEEVDSVRRALRALAPPESGLSRSAAER